MNVKTQPSLQLSALHQENKCRTVYEKTLATLSIGADVTTAKARCSCGTQKEQEPIKERLWPTETLMADADPGTKQQFGAKVTLES